MKPFFPYLVKAINRRSRTQSGESAAPETRKTPETRQILDDIIRSQLKIEKLYNDCCLCCSSVHLRSEMLNILKDNYELYDKELDEAKKRGWVTESPADKSGTETLKAKFSPQG